MDWTVLQTGEQLNALAETIEYSSRVFPYGGTAIAEALSHAHHQFRRSPHTAPRQVIDVSGDGISNEGVPPGELRARLGNARIVVNALAIEESEPDLTAYFFENLIFGDGAFVVSAATFEEYPAKIRLKLLREVTRQTADAR